MEDETNIGSVVFVQNDAGKVLLGRRSNAYGAGEYGAPGGRQFIGEDEKATARRELLEETALVALELIYLGQIVAKDGFIHHMFHCIEYEGEPENTQPHTCEGWEWHGIDSIPENTLIAHKTAIGMLGNHEPENIVLR